MSTWRRGTPSRKDIYIAMLDSGSNGLGRNGRSLGLIHAYVIGQDTRGGYKPNYNNLKDLLENKKVTEVIISEEVRRAFAISNGVAVVETMNSIFFVRAGEGNEA